MVESNVAPGLQRQAEELKRSQLEDMLAGKLETRPRPSELVEQHILHGMFNIQNECPSCYIREPSVQWILTCVFFVVGLI